jgi:transposase
MAGRTSAEVVQAVALIKGGMSAYAAAKTVGIALSTIYRSALYRELVGLSARQPSK